MSARIVFIVQIILAGTTICSGIAAFKERKLMQLFFTVFAAIATFILGIFVDNSLPEPVIDRKADYSNIVLSTEPGLKIEYKISTSGQDEWITYKKPFRL